MAGHEAFLSHTIVDKFPVKIECLDVWNHELLVGTEQGYLLRYEVAKNPDSDGGYKVTILSTNKNFSKRPVQQLTVVERASILISLSDGFVHVHDLPQFRHLRTLQRSRGCHLYSVEADGDNLFLCVAVKKKLLVFALEGGNFVEKKEFSLSDQARTIVWAGKNICVGLKHKYYLISAQTGAMQELCGTGSSRNALPVAARFQDHILLTLERNIGSFFGLDGRPSKNWGLTWSEPPIQVGFHYPFALGILQRFVEVRTAFMGSLHAVQTLMLKNARILCVKGDDIYVASHNHIWKLDPVPLNLQISELVKKKSYVEARVLCENLPAENGDEEAKKNKLNEIRYWEASHLFHKGRYQEAMDLFRELQCNPLHVLTNFPNMLPRDVLQTLGADKDRIEMDEKNLKNALAALVSYLKGFREPPAADAPVNLKDDFAQCTNISVIIDTALLKAYVILDDSRSANALLSEPNSCHIKESETFLPSRQKYQELILLYKSNGLHKRALDLLQKLARSGTAMAGPLHTIQYLKSLGKEHMDLIMEYSRWPLEIAPGEALEIFMEDRKKEDELPPDDVLALINSVKSAADRLPIPYLEWLITERHETDARFHNDLIIRYLDTVLHLKQAQPGRSEYARAGQEPGALGQTRKRLVKFLEESTHYVPQKMLSRFPSDDLYEERAILLSRIKQHNKALSIYAHKLNDPLLAERYCEKHYNPNDEHAKDVYLNLLSVYLQPPDGKPMLAPAMKVLEKYYKRINPAQALQTLPDQLFISDLYEYFERALRDMAETRRNNQVISALLKSENLQVREKSIFAKAKPIRINEDRMCPICNRHIGGVSAIAYYPNGVVIHMGCLKDVHVCPVTGENFGAGTTNPKNAS